MKSLIISLVKYALIRSLAVYKVFGNIGTWKRNHILYFSIYFIEYLFQCIFFNPWQSASSNNRKGQSMIKSSRPNQNYILKYDILQLCWLDSYFVASSDFAIDDIFHEIWNAFWEWNWIMLKFKILRVLRSHTITAWC